MSSFRTVLLYVTVVGTCGLAPGCAHRQLPPPEKLPSRVEIPMASRPHARHPSLAREIIDKTISYQLEQLLDLPNLARRITGHPYEAVNVDEFDEVRNSSWFTNRNGRMAMSLAAIDRGPNTSGPDTSDIWTVLSVKSVGVTPGMIIADASGQRYIIKFDPVDYPELGSGTEAVAARLLHAAGYNVPENYIVCFDPTRLRLDDDTELSVGTDDKRQPLAKRELAMAELNDMLVRANPNPGGGGKIRTLASRFLPGIPVGPFSYTGRRGDDPNDIYAHEHRRELRGLYVVASWINHADMKEENTLDMYDPETGTITHYLIDFGASMGSNSTAPSNPRRGQANSFDLKDTITRLVTFGLYVHDYERAPHLIRHSSVGYLENDLFKPNEWKPMYPAPPFETMTDRDAFWGARIVTSFTDEQIAAAVEAGQWSDEEAAAALLEFLVQRRDRIGRYWFARVNPLDRFEIRGEKLRFVDLAIERGYSEPAATQFELSIRTREGMLLAEDTLDMAMAELQPSWQHVDLPVVVSLRPRREGHHSKPVLLYVTWKVRAGVGRWELIGLRRLD